MPRAAILLVAISMLISSESIASAVLETFPVRLRGWEHCVGGDSTRLTARTARPLWLRMNEGHSWDLSMSPDFPVDPAQTFPLYVESMVPFRTNRLAFWARSFALGGDDVLNGYITLSGFLYVDPKAPEVSRMRGTFIEVGMFDISCGSSGRISTDRRID